MTCRLMETTSARPPILVGSDPERRLLRAWLGLGLRLGLGLGLRLGLGLGLGPRGGCCAPRGSAAWASDHGGGERAWRGLAVGVRGGAGSEG